MPQITIIMYHYVRPILNSAYPRLKGLEFQSFQRQLDFIEKNFQCITVQDILNYIQEGKPLKERACWLTFDDGYIDHVQYVWPELLQRNIQGSFFAPVSAVQQRKMLDVNSIHFILASQNDTTCIEQSLHDLCLEEGFSEKDLNHFQQKYAVPGRFDTAQVIYIKRMLQHALPQPLRAKAIDRLFEMYVQCSQRDFADTLYLSTQDAKHMIASGMFFGSHGNQHVWLNQCNVAEQEHEITASLQFLNDIQANTQDWIMCYPYGGYNQDTLNILKKYHCSLGLTTRVAQAHLREHALLELPRFDTNDFLT